MRDQSEWLHIKISFPRRKKMQTQFQTLQNQSKDILRKSLIPEIQEEFSSNWWNSLQPRASSHGWEEKKKKQQQKPP